MNNSIVVIGSSNTDMILQMQRIPRPGETILGGQFSMAAGGKGANQAVGADATCSASRRSRASGKKALTSSTSPRTTKPRRVWP